MYHDKVYIPRKLQNDENINVLEIWNAKKCNHRFQAVVEIKMSATEKERKKNELKISQLMYAHLNKSREFSVDGWEATSIWQSIKNQNLHLDFWGFFPMNFFARVFALNKNLPSCLPFLLRCYPSRNSV